MKKESNEKSKDDEESSISTTQIEENPANKSTNTTVKKYVLDELRDEVSVITNEIGRMNKVPPERRYISDFEDGIGIYNRRSKFYDPVYVFGEKDRNIERTNVGMKSRVEVQSGIVNKNSLDSNNKSSVRNGFDVKKNICKTVEFYNFARQLPLLFVLRDSRKFVSYHDWTVGYDEERMIRELDKIEKYKKHGKLKSVLSNIVDIKPETNTKWIEEVEGKRKAKLLAEECKRFCKDNIIYTKDKLHIFNFVNVSYMSKEILPGYNQNRIQIPMKRFLETYNVTRNYKSKTEFNIPQLKKNLSSVHSSHMNTLSKITPELSKTQDDAGIVEYKNRNRMKNMNGFGYSRQLGVNLGNRDFTKKFVSGNVYFNIRTDDQKQQRE